MTSAPVFQVAVAVSTYRRNELLTRALESLVEQTLPKSRFVVVLVDNDPLEGARAAVEPFLTSGIAIDYVAEPTPGISAARNCGVRVAQTYGTEWIAFIDDDERALPNWLEELLATANERVDAVQGAVTAELAPGGPTWARRSDLFDRPQLAVGQVLRFASTANLMVRSAVLGKFDGPFDDAYGLSGGSDTELTLRMTTGGYSIVAAPTARVIDHVPVERQSVGWLCRRAARKAALGVHLERTLIYPRTWWVRRAGSMVRWIVRALVLRSRSAMTGDDLLRVRSLVALARARGTWSGLRGERISEYER